MPGFDVETPDGDSSNGPRFSRDISRNTRDLPSLLSSCFPITLKFMNVCYQLKIENTSQKKKIEDREQAKKSAIFGFRHANTRSRFYLFLIYIYIYIFFFFFFFCLAEYYPPWIFLLTYYYTFFPPFKRNIPFEINSWNKSTIHARA